MQAIGSLLLVYKQQISEQEYVLIELWTLKERGIIHLEICFSTIEKCKKWAIQEAVVWIWLESLTPVLEG